MTTDPFTEAARAEAEGKFPPPRESAVIYPLSAVRSHSRGAFLAGAEWARTHLAAQEPTDAAQIIDAMVERALDAMRETLRATLTTPPARPEGAEDIEALIEASLSGDALSDAQVQALADFLASRGVRARREDPTR